MTVMIEIPQTVEEAYLSAARMMGVSVDSLVRDVVVSHAPVSETVVGPLGWPELVEENGVPVLRAGLPLAVTAVEDTLDAVRRERELALLGRL
jgi:hypothetical protein